MRAKEIRKSIKTLESSMERYRLEDKPTYRELIDATQQNINKLSEELTRLSLNETSFKEEFLYELKDSFSVIIFAIVVAIIMLLFR